jgi:hypothetical protein
MEARVAQAAGEALDVAVLDRLPRLDDVQGDLLAMGPVVEVLAAALAAIVEGQADRGAARGDAGIEGRGAGQGRAAVRHRDRAALPRADVDHGEAAEAATGREAIAA